jgi:hypothetical protein
MATAKTPKAIEAETNTTPPPELVPPVVDKEKTAVQEAAIPMVGVKMVNGTFIDLHYKDADNLDQNIKLSQASPILKVPATQENLSTLDAYVSRGIVNLIKQP